MYPILFVCLNNSNNFFLEFEGIIVSSIRTSIDFIQYVLLITLYTFNIHGIMTLLYLRLMYQLMWVQI